MTEQQEAKNDARLANRISRLINWGHWFTFFNILLAMVIGSRYLLESGLPDSLLGVAYTVVTWAGHFAFLTFILFVITLFPLSILLPMPRLVRLSGAVLATAGQLVLLADTFVFGQYRLHLNNFIWDLLKSGEGQVLSEGYFTWMALGGLAVLIFALELTAGNWFWKRQSKFKEKKLGFHLATVFVSCFFSSHLLHVWADANLYYPIMRQGAVFPLSYPATAKTFMARHGLLDMEDYKRKQRQAEGSESLLRLPLDAGQCRRSPNILLVVVDGLRPDALAAMPGLSRYRDEFQVFERHFSGSNDAKDGLFSLFYGLPAVYEDAVAIGGNDSVLMGTLAKAGYAFGIFSSEGLAQSGLDTTALRHQAGGAAAFTGTISRRDAKAAQAMQGWLAKQQGPFFGYLQLSAPAHFSTPNGYENPFQPDWQVVNLNELDRDSDPTPVKNRYRNAAHYSDSLLAPLLDGLKAQGRLDDTIVVVTSDHGMAFNDMADGQWGYNSSFSRFQTQVPLLIHWPGMTPARHDKLTAHQDLVPTLLGTGLDCELPASRYASGMSLFADQGHQWVVLGDYHDFAIVQPDRVMVMNKLGQYSIRDNDYRELPDAKIRVAVLMDALKELKRFYR
ncbi:DUF3413 domain-containing protein [Gallaecimonas sp. GXIMD4217]|uniref:DUF3413 domain-containing protein n=1 Tax=Gallaecimonas sp. GXIMD4217 TaxID=3131927 RepID=UPI00311B2138